MLIVFNQPTKYSLVLLFETQAIIYHPQGTVSCCYLKLPCWVKQIMWVHPPQFYDLHMTRVG